MPRNILELKSIKITPEKVPTLAAAKRFAMLKDFDLKEISWARTCSCYVNQVLIETKEGLGLDKDSEPMRDEKGVIGHIGHRERTLPLDYLRRILKVFNCKAVVTRPLLETEWRPAK